MDFSMYWSPNGVTVKSNSSIRLASRPFSNIEKTNGVGK